MKVTDHTVDIDRLVEQRPSLDNPDFFEMVERAHAIHFGDNWVVMLIDASWCDYLVAKSTVPADGVEYISQDSDSIYPFELARFLVKMVRNRVRPIVTDVEGKSEKMRKALIRLGAVEQDDYYYFD